MLGSLHASRAAPSAPWVEVSVLKAEGYYEFWLYVAGL